MELTREDCELIGRCLRACVEGTFFPDWEFDTLFGLTRDEVRAVLVRWPDADPSDIVVRAAVGNAIGHLWGYPHGGEDELRRRFGIDAAALEHLASRWFGRKVRP